MELKEEIIVGIIVTIIGSIAGVMINNWNNSPVLTPVLQEGYFCPSYLNLGTYETFQVIYKNTGKSNGVFLSSVNSSILLFRPEILKREFSSHAVIEGLVVEPGKTQAFSYTIKLVEDINLPPYEFTIIVTGKCKFRNLFLPMSCGEVQYCCKYRRSAPYSYTYELISEEC